MGRKEGRQRKEGSDSEGREEGRREGRQEGKAGEVDRKEGR